jgi:hypothetical protein
MTVLREAVERQTSNRRGVRLPGGQVTRLGVYYASRRAHPNSCCIVLLLHLPEPETNDYRALRPYNPRNALANGEKETSRPPEDSQNRALPRAGRNQEIDVVVFASDYQRLCLQLQSRSRESRNSPSTPFWQLCLVHTAPQYCIPNKPVLGTPSNTWNSAFFRAS